MDTQQDGKLFVLKVFGDPVPGHGIRDGSWVVAREQKTAEDGDVVVVMIEGDAVLKVFPDLGAGATLIGKVVSVHATSNAAISAASRQ